MSKRRNQLQRRITRLKGIENEINKEIHEIEKKKFIDVAKQNIGVWYSDNYSFIKIIEVSDDNVLALCSRNYNGLISFEIENLYYRDLNGMCKPDKIPEKLQKRIEKFKKLFNQ